jgi:carbon monoxide dehydrogenase subunit G
MATSVEEQSAETNALQVTPNPSGSTIDWNIPDGIATIINVMGQKMIELPASAQQADVRFWRRVCMF